MNNPYVALLKKMYPVLLGRVLMQIVGFDDSRTEVDGSPGTQPPFPKGSMSLYYGIYLGPKRVPI